MADLTIREMTKREAEAEVAAFTGDWSSARSRLLNMFEGKAHKALGYATFEEFAQDRLGINVSERTIANHLAAARVMRNLSVGDSSKSATVALLVPLKAALELNKLPDSEQAEAWKEIKTLESFGTHLPKQVARATRDIVARRLNITEKREESTRGHGRPEDDEEETPPAPVRPKPNMTPIVPPTYDRGPEFDDEPIQEPAPPAPVEVPAPTAPTPEPMTAEDCIGTIALSFVITFDKIMRGGGSLEELHMDVIAFRKKYSV